MGKSLYECSPAAAKVFEEAGEDIRKLCFEADSETLKRTDVTQPTVYTVSMAAYAALMEALGGKTDSPPAECGSADASGSMNVEISGVAGFSLGEYAALTAAGSIASVSDGIAIVRERGKLMHEAGLDGAGNPKGGMIAGLAEKDAVIDCVEAAREDGILCAVNFNSPKQTVVAGDFAALERFRGKAAEFKVRAKDLSVSTAFHSPMMVPAAEKLRSFLEGKQLNRPKVKVFADVTACDIMAEKPQNTADSDFIADMLAKQCKSPVRWQEIVENMIADGIECFVELGPGKTLSGFVKKINPDVKVCNVQDEESLRQTVEFLKSEEKTC